MELRQSRSLGQKALRYFKDPSVSTFRKLAGVFALVYFVMPVDVIPDILPVLGWLDDLGVLSALAMFMAREIRKHAERDAQRGPVIQVDEISDADLSDAVPVSARRVSPVTGRPRR